MNKQAGGRPNAPAPVEVRRLEYHPVLTPKPDSLLPGARPQVPGLTIAHRFGGFGAGGTFRGQR